MRKNINIVWLDDRFNSDMVIDGYMKKVKSVIKSLGYEANVYSFVNYEQALTFCKIKKNRVDFFVSDYNLEEKKTGLDFLIELRSAYDFKQSLILYSGTNEDKIKEYIKQAFDSYDLKHLTNFHFFTSNYTTFEYEMKSIISFVLYRWDELNALRSFYVSEHAILEGRLSVIFGELYSDNDIAYAQYIQILDYYLRAELLQPKDRLMQKWKKSKNIRNDLSHCTESYDEEKGFYIASLINKRFKIYESDVITYRKDLVDLYVEIDIILAELENTYKHNIDNWCADQDFSFLLSKIYV